jgi:hypothetical protein
MRAPSSPSCSPSLALLAAGATVAAPSAWAQGAPVGAVAYAPLAAAAAVPTLSQWALFALVLAITGLGGHLLRRRGWNTLRALVPGLLAGAALLSTPWPAEVMAQAVSEVLLDNPAGGVADIPDHPSLENPFMDYLHEYEVRNVTGRSQRITAVSVTAAHILLSFGSNLCTVGQTLAPMEVCYVRVGRPH